MVSILAIAAVSLLSLLKTLGLYFWHDDFSWFYLLRNEKCFSFWPYNSFCSYLGVFYRLFGYQVFWYRVSGILLLCLTSLAFFVFVKQFFEKRKSLLLTLVFSTLFVGSGVFLEAHSPFLVLTPILLFLVSLNLLKFSLKRDFNIFIFTTAILVFGLSTFIAPIRTSTNFLPAIAFVFLFFEKISVKKKIIISLTLFFVYYLSFFVFPFGVERRFLSSSDTGSIARSFDARRKMDFALTTFGSFVITDDLQNMLLAKVNSQTLDLIRKIVAVLGFLTILIFVRKRNNVFKKITFFSLIWIFSFYLPYALRSDFRLLNNHRYLLSLFPGLILLWGVFHEKKHWKLITVVIIVLGVVQSNVFFERNLLEGRVRSSFYYQLHSLQPSLPEGSILFFDYPQAQRNRIADFFRVGYFPSSASVGTEYALNQEKVNLITEPGLLREYLTTGKFNIQNFYSFYFDGKALFNTTKATKDILSTSPKIVQKIGKSRGMKFVFDENKNVWTGENNGVEFLVDGFAPLLPVDFAVEMTASFPKTPIPYTQGCEGCSYSPEMSQNIFSYIIASRRINEKRTIEATSVGEGTKPESMADGNPKTYWLSNRQQWFDSEKPVVNIYFSGKEKVSGIVLHSPTEMRLPSDFQLQIDDKPTNFTTEKLKTDGIKILFKADNQNVSKISIKILATGGKDAPIISEIDVIPNGFENIDFNKIGEVQNSPASTLRSGNDLENLGKYMKSGVKACLEWDQEGYGKDLQQIDIFVDGKKHNYVFDLPPIGNGSPIFRIGCLNYPVEIEVFSVSIRYLGSKN